MECIIQTSDRIQLKGHLFKSELAPIGVMVIVHGMGEHGGRYAHVADFYNKKGIHCLAFDLRGHGKSDGQRGHTPSFTQLMDDLQKMQEEAKKQFPDLPILWYGHSMGGNLSLNYFIRNQPNIKAAIISAPYIRLAFDPPKWKTVLGKWSASILPTLSQPTGLDAKAISRDKKVVDKYVKDPLVHDKITSSFFVNVHFAGPYILENQSKLNVPIYLLHGKADQLTSFAASEELAKKNTKITWKPWPNLYHEMHNEPEQNEVLNAQWEWLKQQI